MARKKKPQLYETLEKAGLYRLELYVGGETSWTFHEPKDVVQARKALKRLKVGQVGLKHLNAILSYHGLWLFRSKESYFYQLTVVDDHRLKVPAAETIPSLKGLNGKRWLEKIDDALARWYRSDDRVAATLLRATHGF